MEQKRSKRLIRLVAIGAAGVLALGPSLLQHLQPERTERAMVAQAAIAPVPRAETRSSADRDLVVPNDGDTRPRIAALPVPPSDIVMPPLPGVATGRAIPEMATPGVRLAAMAPEAPPVDTEPRPRPVTEVPAPCPETLKVTAVPGGMAYVALNAPCRAGEVVTLSHSGISFDVTVPAPGRFAKTVPVLDTDQPFVASAETGLLAEARLSVAPADGFRHVALHATATSGLALHALEDGARHGDDGHVWAGAPREVLAGVRGEGGFLTHLGDSGTGHVVEVYTFPVDAGGQAAPVAVSVELEVTPDNCGTDVSGRLLQQGPDNAVEVFAITVAVPGCDATGDILVLKNILGDMKIAAN